MTYVLPGSIATANQRESGPPAPCISDVPFATITRAFVAVVFAAVASGAASASAAAAHDHVSWRAKRSALCSCVIGLSAVARRYQLLADRPSLATDVK